MKIMFSDLKRCLLETGKTQKCYVCIVFFLILVFSIVTGCSGNGDREIKKAAPVPVRQGKVKHVKSIRTIPVSGTVVSPYAPTYVSFLVAGRAQAVLPREGEYVANGQLLAELDPTDYRSALEGASALATEARVVSDQAKKEYDRMAFLFERKSLAENDFDKIKAARDAAVKKLDQALAAEKVRKKQLTDTTLHSPVKGFISKRMVEPGQTVATGTPVFEIVRMDTVEILVGVPETDIHLVAVGQKAVVSLPAMPDRYFDGTIRVINVSADPNTRTYMTRITVPNPEHLLLLGMVAEARISSDEILDVITLPGDAITRDPQGAPLVYIYYPDQKRVYSKRITVGRLTGDDIEIREGLSGDERIVIAGQDKLRDGIEVAVVNSSTPGQ
jgi:RND family efflux transporter MFP subunit